MLVNDKMLEATDMVRDGNDWVMGDVRMSYNNGWWMTYKGETVAACIRTTFDLARAWQLAKWAEEREDIRMMLEAAQ